MKTPCGRVTLLVVLCGALLGGCAGGAPAPSPGERASSCGPEVWEMAQDAQKVLAKYPTVPITNTPAIKEQFRRALRSGTDLSEADADALAAIASRFLTDRFGKTPSEYLAQCVAKGWTPKTESDLAESQGQGTLAWAEESQGARGTGMARTTLVLTAFNAAAPGVNRVTAIVVGPDVCLAVRQIGDKAVVLESALGNEVWMGGFASCGRPWMNSPEEPLEGGDQIHIACVVQTASGWRSPTHLLFVRTSGPQGWLLTSFCRSNTPIEGLGSEW